MSARPMCLDLDTVRWLARRSDAADFDWARLEPIADGIFPPLLSTLLTSAESDAIDAPELSSREVIDAVRGAQPSLAWFVGAVGRALQPRVGRALWHALSLPIAVQRAGWPATALGAGPSRGVLRRVARRRAQAVLGAARRVGLARPAWLPEAIHGDSRDVFAYGLGSGRWIALWFRRRGARRRVAASWASLLIERGRATAAGRGTALPSSVSMEWWAADPARGQARLRDDHARVLRRFCPTARITGGRWAVPGGGFTGRARAARACDEDRLGAACGETAARLLSSRRSVSSTALAALAAVGLPTGEAWTAAQRRHAVPFGVLVAGADEAFHLPWGQRESLTGMIRLRSGPRESAYLRRAVRCRWFFDAVMEDARRG